MIATTLQGNNLSQIVAFFLAEILRSRRTSLKRAAEIAHKVISVLPQVDSETGILSMLTDVEKEFEEIAVLKQALHFGYEESDVRVYEKEIKDYASKIFVKDMVLSARFLQDAATPEMTIQKLCLKYPEFCHTLAGSCDPVFLQKL